MSSSRTQVGTFTTDASLIVRTWDDSLAWASGIAATRAVGRPLADVIPSLASRGLLKRFEEVVSSGAVHVFSPGLHRYVVPCPPLTPSNRFEHMQQRVTVGPLRDGDRVAGLMAAIEDVTARVETERELAEALASGEADWQTRRTVVQELSRRPSADFAPALVELIRTHHRDFSVLSSSLQLLAGTDVDVSDALVELLHDAEVDLRIQAALALGQQPAPAAERALIGALDDDNDNVRFQIIESLGRLRATAAVDRLLAVAESKNTFLAFAAIDALGAIRDPRAGPRLVSLLERDDLRLAVIGALQTIGDEAAVGPLVKALNGFPDAAVPATEAIAGIYERLEHVYQQGASVAHIVATAIDAAGTRHLLAALDASAGPSVTRVLGWLDSDEASRGLVRLLAVPNARATAMEMLPRHGARVVPLLLEQLAERNEEVRHAAIVALGRVGSPEATPALLALIDEAPGHSAAVAGALARILDPAAFEALIGLLAHADPSVRQAAVGALNSIGHPSMPLRIVRLLHSDDPLMRESAIRVAGYFGYPDARDRIIQLASDPIESVRCAAMEQLPFFDNGQSLPTLLNGLSSGTPGTRAAAVRALAQVDDDRARQALVDALLDQALWVRYFAARALTEHHDGAAVGALRRAALEDPAPPVRIAAVEALAAIEPATSGEVFIRLAQEPTDELAAAAVAALGRVNSPEARQTLLGHARDERRVVRLAALAALATEPTEDATAAIQQSAATDADDEVRRAAIDTLSDIARRGGTAGQGATESLVGLLTDSVRGEDAAAALARLPAAGLALIARHLRHPDPATRRAVVETLGRSRHSEATTLLLDALNDEAAAVRDAAVLALGRRRHVV